MYCPILLSKTKRVTFTKFTKPANELILGTESK
jgi:hypothetical protein